ncbi:hypothetical protein RJ639_020150 [Escallonia herrerae]|uniref:Inactive purple acid phosphatase-like protein n=1 Tax=Escallonia herrerae TaxID=1293975 RepID=A0AA88VCH9_9ASTE|nr:hypothetical protein RJ639_020150 [Escallonia herrerae]
MSSTPFNLRIRTLGAASPLHHRVGGVLELRRKQRRRWLIRCCCPDSAVPIGRTAERAEEWPSFEAKKSPRRARIHATPALPFASSQYVHFTSLYYDKKVLTFAGISIAPDLVLPPNKRNSSHAVPREVLVLSPVTLHLKEMWHLVGLKYCDAIYCLMMHVMFTASFIVDTGIANEKDWGISLANENVVESGTNEDGSTWYRESGEDLGDKGYRCRWTRMGGQSHDGSSEWKETELSKLIPEIWQWWEKSDWIGYKELGVEKSGRNAGGDSWWETWREVLYQDEWSNLARIERSAQKQAKSGTENAGWYENWWEKYDAKGWTEKGAQKYGRLNEQSWWEKWGEQYDGRGSVLKWTDKWAETELGTKWGDKWEEKFFAGIGSRQGETWHVSPSSERWSRTWGEEHFGNDKVHKYGKSTTGESWDIVVDEETYYEADPHYGWADVVGDSSQLLSINPRDRPPGVYPNLDFGSSAPAPDNNPPIEPPLDPQ